VRSPALPYGEAFAVQWAQVDDTAQALLVKRNLIRCGV
jgi:hypothetical protein